MSQVAHTLSFTCPRCETSFPLSIKAEADHPITEVQQSALKGAQENHDLKCPKMLPPAKANECPKCHEKAFNVRGRFEEGLGQWTEGRECANCGFVYRRRA